MQLGDDAPLQQRRQVGLNHMAWRVESLDDLKEFYARIKEQKQPIDHIADHGISLGIYLRDPDGNGVEVYYEMPRAEWPVDYHVFSRDKVGPRPFPWSVGRRDGASRCRCRNPPQRSSSLTLPRLRRGPSPPRQRERGAWLASSTPLPFAGEGPGEERSRVRGRCAMKSYKIAALGGDGIGKEVIAAGLEVLASLRRARWRFRRSRSISSIGARTITARTGVMMPEDGLERLRDFDAIFFGAVAIRHSRPRHAVGPAPRRSARGSTSTPMSARPASCPASRSPLRHVAGPSSTG